MASNGEDEAWSHCQPHRSLGERAHLCPPLTSAFLLQLEPFLESHLDQGGVIKPAEPALAGCELVPTELMTPIFGHVSRCVRR